MKLDPSRIAPYLADPGGSRGALVFGEDNELVRERVRHLTRTVAGGVDDPFRVASLSREALGSLTGELATRSLTGERRVVLLTDVTDGACEPVRKAFQHPTSGFLVVEAGALPTKSKLRMFFETERDVASIPCLLLNRSEAIALFSRTLESHGVNANAETLAWAEQRLVLDRARVRAEADRLALYAEPDRRVTLIMAQLCLSGGSELVLDELIDAVFSGDAGRADSGIEGALLEGATPVGLLMGVMAHLTRLHRCALLLRSGVAESEAMKALRPPVFFRRQPAFALALRTWSVERLAGAAGVVATAELGCKQTGSPADLLVRNALLRIARSARGPR